MTHKRAKNSFIYIMHANIEKGEKYDIVEFVQSTNVTFNIEALSYVILSCKLILYNFFFR